MYAELTLCSIQSLTAAFLLKHGCCKKAAIDITRNEGFSEWMGAHEPNIAAIGGQSLLYNSSDPNMFVVLCRRRVLWPHGGDIELNDTNIATAKGSWCSVYGSLSIPNDTQSIYEWEIEILEHDYSAFVRNLSRHPYICQILQI